MVPVTAAQVGLFEDLAAAASGWELDAEGPDLPSYDWILVNSSAGKDSMAALSTVVRLCDAAGVDRARVVVVHADLGDMEWQGTRELAAEHAAQYGLRFEVVRRTGPDLLARVLERNETLRARPGDTGTAPPWYGPQTRWCTSDFKVSQVERLITRLVGESRAAGVGRRKVRILNAVGIRAAESTARASKAPFGRDPAHWTTPPVAARRATRTRPAVAARPGRAHGQREVHRWHPVFTLTEAQVWAEIAESGLRPHPAYGWGSPRLSCVFCFYAPVPVFVLGARRAPALARRFADVEAATGFTYRPDGVPMSEVITRAEAEGPVDA